MQSKKIPVLIGDIGGTNSRLSIWKMSSKFGEKPEVVDHKKWGSFDFDSFNTLVETYLKPFKNTPNYPVYAAIGVPAPVSNNKVDKITNIPTWKSMDGVEIAKELGMKEVVFLNDFVVNGYGIQANLKEGEDYIMWNDKPIDKDGPKATIGPGTGLGMGYLVKEINSDYYIVRPSEGGHQDYPAKNDLQWKYLNYLRGHYQIHHISIERACCGQAITAMYKFISLEEKIEGDKDILAEIETIDKSASNDEMVKLNTKIVAKGLKKEDKVARRVIEFFLEMYGFAAGNLAVVTLCTGGLYLLGGMSAALEDVIKNEPFFMNNFIDKGRFKEMLSNYPVILIRNTDLGMIGAAEYGRRLIEKEENKK